MMTRLAEMHTRDEREARLDPEWLHLFPLASMAASLREEPEYRENGQSGILLMKTEHLRVVLEVASEGAEIGEHTVAGPAVVYVLEGTLELTCVDQMRVAKAGEMIVVPHDRPRSIVAESDVAFLLAISIDEPA